MTWNHERIVELLLRAGGIAVARKRDLRRELKPDASVVTQADREIEALFCQELERPDDGVYLIGEETVDQKGEDYLARALAGETWVVDPIDGTSPYAHGMPTWGVSIGHMLDGRLTAGAVYLPEFGELVISDGGAVLEASRDSSSDGGWTWRELAPSRDRSPSLLVGITQALAKRGRVVIPNPVQVLGAAVVPLVGLVQGRFIAYIGSVKLWDIAGALPLVLRHGFVASVKVGDQARRVTAAVDDSSYDLAAGSKRRWKLRSDLLICRPEDEEYFRERFCYEER
jgi:myo-inositol-1(or 4)-monophosphatase